MGGSNNCLCYLNTLIRFRAYKTLVAIRITQFSGPNSSIQHLYQWVDPVDPAFFVTHII